MTARELFSEIDSRSEEYEFSRAANELSQMEERGRADVKDVENWGYYRWLAVLMAVKRPKQVVELGGAMGVSTLMMLSELPKESSLYSVTLPEHGLEFSYIRQDYPNLTKILGDDKDLSIWPEGVALGDTDIWFIDTEHTEEQLRAELKLYRKFWKPGAIVLLDDIKLNEGMWRTWLDWPGDKYNASTLHFSGFGITIQGENPQPE